MKRIVTFLLLCFLLLQPTAVYATESTTYTYTTSVDGEWIRTQDAYLPGEVLFRNEELLQPEDIFIREGQLYLLDTGNKRVGRYDLAEKTLDWLPIGGLKKPTGIFVDAEKKIYIADYGAECVYAFDEEGAMLLRIARPTSYLFSDRSRYKPKNVVVTSGGTLYVVGEGSYEGVMQFNAQGEFEGYFAAGTTPISLLESIQELIFTREQLERLFNRSPRTIYNIDLASRDLLFSVVQDSDNTLAWNAAKSSKGNNVKLHNFGGVDIFREDGLIDEWNFVDVAAKPEGGCFAVTYAGVINDYDPNGELLFSFGGRAVASDRYGLFTYAAAIACDENGLIYVLDREKGIVQSFYPTEFALTTYDAINKMESGDYQAASSVWGELLKLNGMSRIAHNGFGKTSYFMGDYESAMEHFGLACNREDYSEAFWEVRDNWIHDNGAAIVVCLIAVCCFFALLKRIRRGRETTAVGQSVPVLREGRFIRRFLRHPIDGCYDIKKGRRGSPAVAAVLYVLLIAVYLWDYLYRGFIFNPAVGREVSVPVVLAVLVIPLALWIIGSYLIGTIRDGEGSLRSIYTATAYALTPYILGCPAVLLLTYVLTNNEGFVITLAHAVLLCWSGINLFLSTMEIHNYKIRETAMNILIILFFIAMAIVACVILYLIWLSVWEYVSQVLGEVRFRVFS